MEYTWSICRTGFQEKNIAQQESLFSLGNGYIGWRGNYEENYSHPMGVQGCYVNGFHETEKIRYGEIAYGYAEDSQTMLNVTNGQRILLSVKGKTLHPDQAKINNRTLSMQDGVLRRETIYEIEGGTLCVNTTRLVSFMQAHIAAIRMEISCSTSCQVQVSPLLDGDVTNLVCTDDPRVGSGLHGRVLSIPRMGSTDVACGMVQHTEHTQLAVACAMSCNAQGYDHCRQIKSEMMVGCAYSFALNSDKTVVIEKIVCYDNGSIEEEDVLLASTLANAQKARQLGFDRLYKQQVAYMQAFWHRCGICVEGDNDLLQGLRFNMFHLLQSTGRDGKTNVAAKGLTGEGYEGQTFWDTETYIFPMFLHVAPEIAKALLVYRYNMLPFARERAREMGHPIGALYPWRTINGREASAYYPAGTAQIHINADIALAVKRYWEATGDDDFLVQAGAQMVCETARLFFDLGFFNPKKDNRFCINEVTGPDEYNALVDNNAYTNIMAATNMSFAADLIDWLKKKQPEAYKKIAQKIKLSDSEANAWRGAAQAMYIPKDQKTGLIWQDDGFMNRKPWPLKEIPKENFPLLLHYHPLVIYRHMVCKQADTVLAMLLLPWKFTEAEKQVAFHYYDAVTTHDSSLSMAAFSAVASRIGEMDVAYRYFRETARLDLEDTHGNTKDGLHMANMAGTWVCIAYGFGGLQINGDEIAFAPVLPAQLKGYGFRVFVKGRLIEIHVDEAGPVYKLIEGDPILIVDRGVKVELN